MKIRPEKIKVNITYNELILLGKIISDNIFMYNNYIEYNSILELLEYLRNRAGNGGVYINLKLEKSKAFLLNDMLNKLRLTGSMIYLPIKIIQQIEPKL